MLKKSICIILVSIAVVLLFCSCRTDVKHTEETIGNEKTTEAVETAGIGSESPRETAIAAWKAMYLSYIEEQKEEYESYALVFVDDDEVPELFCCGYAQVTGENLFSVKNGTLSHAPLYRIGGGCYVPRGGIAFNYNGHMGDNFIQQYVLTENGFEQVVELHCIEHAVDYEASFEEMEYTYQYFINDKEVSEEEYTAALSILPDTKTLSDLDEYAVSYEKIIEQIQNF